MRSRWIVLSLVFGGLFQPESGFAANRALYLGGGCETEWGHERGCEVGPADPYCERPTATSGGGATIPQDVASVPAPRRGRYNMFAEDADLATRVLTPANGWNHASYLFGGADWTHRPTASTPRLTRESLFRTLAAELRAFPKGTNQQFLLTISTHGSPTPHGICMGDGTIVPISEIKEQLEKFKDKGIKVGVIDSSCFSGGTAEQFVGSGMCAISATGSDISTHSGPLPSTSILSQGLPAGQRASIRAPNDANHTMVSEYRRTPSADFNADGRITLAEAHRVELGSPGIGSKIPRSSECTLMGGSGSIRAMLNACERYLSPAGPFEMIEADASLLSTGTVVTATNERICDVERLATQFGNYLSAMQDSTRVALSAELAEMGYARADDRTLVADVRRRIDRLVAARAEIERLDRIVDAHCTHDPWAPAGTRPTDCDNVPAAVLQPLQAAWNGVYGEKEAIINGIRQLTYFACGHERATRPVTPEDACESFRLFGGSGT